MPSRFLGDTEYIHVSETRYQIQGMCSVKGRQESQQPQIMEKVEVPRVLGAQGRAL